MIIFGKEYKIVSEKDQKDKSNTLYLYIENIDGVTYAKFGEAFKQTVWDRYAATGYTQHSKQIKVWKSSVGDKPIHRLLRSMFTWAGNKSANPLNTNEAYIIKSSDELDNMIDTITDIVKNQKIGPDFFRNRCENLTYQPRSYQQDIINKAQNVLSVKDRVLVNLSTRGGKSFVSLNICKNIIGNADAANILILTPFPAAEGSFEEVANLHKAFKGWKYIRLSAKTKADELCDKNIIFCSYQFYDEGKAICQKLIQDLFIDVIVLDECHNTSDSERTKKLLKTLNYGKLLYMSGTPFNDIYSGYFTKDEVVTFDFIDFIKFAKAHPDEVKLPSLHIKNVCNVKMLEDELTAICPDVFKDADAFDFPTIFSNDQHAEAFFTWLFRPVKSNPLIVNTKRWFDLNDQKRVIAFFSTTAQVDVAKKALEKLLPNYKVLSVSGEDTDFTSVDERKVNEAFKEENTIILTCGKLTTGVTLPKLDTIWYFKNTASAEQFIQILFRTMTPCDGKTDATMYCFDSEASLKVVKEYATVRLDEMSTNITKGENDTYQTVISDILSCINFTYLTDKYQWVDEDPDDYFEKLHKMPYSHSVVAAFQNFNSFDGVEDLGTEELKEKDLTVTKAQGEATKGQCDRNNNLKKLFRESNKKPSDDSHEEERTSNKVVKQLLKLLLNIDKKIFVNDFVKSYKDLEKLMPKELKDYEANYKQLLEDNKARLNQMIEDIRYKESHNKVDELLHGLSFSNSTDMKTPEVLLDKMFGKFENYNGTICDPCAGTGTMLMCAVEKYGFKKENCYGIDIDEDNVAICRKLGFVNIIQGDAQDTKSWEKLKHMKFNHIIMNPPYDKNLHLKILQEAMKHSDDVVNLSPIRWLQDPLAEYKKNSDWKKFEDIRKHIEILDVVSAAEAQKLFSSGQYENLGIYHLTENGGLDTLPKPLISQELFDKVNLPTYQGKYKSFYSERVSENYKNFDKPFVKVSALHGNVDAKDWFDIITPQKELAMSKEQNKGGSCTFTYNFDTEEEAENFFAYCQTKFVKACNGNVKTNIRWPGYAVPFMPTYTHPWTNEMLYEYFDLTEEEIKTIEQEIK